MALWGKLCIWEGGVVLEGVELGGDGEKEGFEVRDCGVARAAYVRAREEAEDIFRRLRKFPELWPGQQISKFGVRTMTYAGPVGIVGCNILLLGEPEDALLENQLGLGGSHGCPGEAERCLRDRESSTWRRVGAWCCTAVGRRTVVESTTGTPDALLMPRVDNQSNKQQRLD